MKTDKLKIMVSILESIVVCIFIVLLGPLDFFSHGYFANEVNISQIDASMLSTYNLSNGEYNITFTPLNRHFTGIEVYFENNPQENIGSLLISITDNDGKEIETETIGLDTIKSNEWHKFYVHGEYNLGKKYILHISAKDSINPPSVLLTDSKYVSPELQSGNALIALAYKHSTFTGPEKLLLVLLIGSAWLCFISRIFKTNIRNLLKLLGIFGILVSVLSWNYTSNFMDNQNTQFTDFQNDSEAIVVGTLKANKIASYYPEGSESKYGLGNYIDTHGYIDELKRNQYTPITNNQWTDGYSNDGEGILIQNNLYNKEVAVAGNKVKFINGEIYQIENVIVSGDSLQLYLNGIDINASKNGQINSIVFLDANGNVLPTAYLEPYQSQYGLQGKIFTELTKSMSIEKAITFLHVGCSILTAIVLVLISFLLYRKYNIVLASCFYIVFWLSPWIVNFARNLYWVEFTWFIPMAIGLFCALKVENRTYRIISYILTIVSICIKCLCGYEYISTIMMCLITFLLVDLVVAITSKDKKKTILLLRTTFIIGVMAIIGFAIAIVVHAGIKGDGNIILGIKYIIREDVMRRTSGADLNKFDPVYWPSFNASIWQVCSLYFNFQTEIIAGVDGNLFPLLSIMPAFIISFDFHNQKKDYGILSLYIVSFLGAISWFALAKSHSFIHTHINFVLWYCGFIQVCIYVIIDKLIRIVRGR